MQAVELIRSIPEHSADNIRTAAAIAEFSDRIGGCVTVDLDADSDGIADLKRLRVTLFIHSFGLRNATFFREKLQNLYRKLTLRLTEAEVLVEAGQVVA